MLVGKRKIDTKKIQNTMYVELQYKVYGAYNAYQGLCHKVNKGLTTASEN